MATQSQYEVQPVELTGGLDFTTPKIAVAPGTLADGYNFEVADRLGYKRIDGLEPFDGRLSPSLVYSSTVWFRITYNTSTFADGDYLYRESVDNPIFGIKLKTYSISGVTYIAVVITDYEEYYKLLASQIIYNQAGTANATLVSKGGISLLSGSASYDTAEEQFDEYVTLYGLLDAMVTGLPSGRYCIDHASNNVRYGPATGMQWYKGRLYITQDLDQAYFYNGANEFFANDVLQTDPSGVNYRVLDYKLISGNFGDGDAQGVILLHKELNSTSWFAATADMIILRNNVDVGSLSLSYDPSPNAFADTWRGGFWRSTNLEQANEVVASQGWEWIDCGWQFNYKDGQAYGTPAIPPPKVGREVVPTEQPINGNTSDLVFTAGTQASVIWTLQGGAASIVDALNVQDAKFLRSVVASGYGASGLTTLTMSGFDFSTIPTDAEILGVEISIRAKATNNDASRPKAFKVSLSAPNSTPLFTNPLTTSYTTVTVGGPNNLFNGDLTRDFLVGASFNVKIAPTHLNTSVGETTEIDLVTMKVYYQDTVGQLYFWNGTDDVTATIVNYYDGTEGGVDGWATGDAFGQMQVYNVTPVGATNRTYISSDDEIRTAAAGAGTLVAKVTSEMAYAGPASFRQMQAQESRAQIIVANFYGNEEWEAMYGVNGAGRGWVYDDFYFRYLYTGLNGKLDKPRHIVFHKHYLALGYKAGNVTFSVQGEPENFNGADGARSFDLGDRVTGLLRMNGDTLGVFCESSIAGIQGNEIEDFTTMVLSPYEGAIEYTVVDMGRPIYCSYRGISTFDQTAAYGNFLGTRLSDKITPWLLPRLTNRAPALSFDSTRKGVFQALSQQPVCAFPKRGKNQYCLSFDDGYILVMTLVGPEQRPMFTLHRLYDGTTTYDSGTPLVPFSISSSVDEHGADRIHMSDFSEIGDPTARRFCYEIDRGWLYRTGTATNKIHGNFVQNHTFFGGPHYGTIKKIRYHSQSKGRGAYQVTAQADYSETFPGTSSTEYQPIDLPAAATMPANGPTDFSPTTALVPVTKQGLSLTIKVQERAVNQPPVVFQSALIQFQRDRGDI